MSTFVTTFQLSKGEKATATLEELMASVKKILDEGKAGKTALAVITSRLEESLAACESANQAFDSAIEDATECQADGTTNNRA